MPLPRHTPLLLPLLSLVLALCLSCAAFAQPAEEALSINTILDLGADGSVENVSVHEPQLLPHVATAVANTIRRMRFDPVIVDGSPRRVRTSALFRVGFEGSDTQRKLLVGLIEFGLPVAIEALYPRFPEGAQARGHGAEVWLLVEVDDSGKVLAAEPAAVVLSALPRASGDDREREASVNEFIEMAQQTVRLWNIRMVEADAEGRLRLIVPFSFGVQEEGGAAREFAPTLFPAMGQLGGDFNALRARSRSLPAGTLLQLSSISPR